MGRRADRALDSETSADIIELLRALHRDGLTLVMVPHDDGIGAAAPRLVRKRDGQVVSDKTLEESSVTAFVLAVVVSLPFVFIIVARPLQRRLAIRNATRRPIEALGVVIALVATWGLTTSEASWAEDLEFGVAWGDIVIIVGLSVIAAVGAAILPARTAADIRPAVALRLAD